MDHVSEEQRAAALVWAKSLLDDKEALAAVAKTAFAELDVDGSTCIDTNEAQAKYDQIVAATKSFSQDSLQFMSKVLHRSGLGDETYAPPSERHSCT